MKLELNFLLIVFLSSCSTFKKKYSAELPKKTCNDAVETIWAYPREWDSIAVENTAKTVATQTNLIALETKEKIQMSSLGPKIKGTDFYLRVSSVEGIDVNGEVIRGFRSYLTASGDLGEDDFSSLSVFFEEAFNKFFAELHLTPMQVKGGSVKRY